MALDIMAVAVSAMTIRPPDLAGFSNTRSTRSAMSPSPPDIASTPLRTGFLDTQHSPQVNTLSRKRSASSPRDGVFGKQSDRCDLRNAEPDRCWRHFLRSESGLSTEGHYVVLRR